MILNGKTIDFDGVLNHCTKTSYIYPLNSNKMKKTLFILLTLMLLIGCSEDRDIRISSPYPEPIKVEIKGGQGFKPIRIIQSEGAGIDLSYQSTYTVPTKHEFKVIRSDSKLDKFVGFDFNARFYHYSKLLTIEYKSIVDSTNLVKHYNNPISWTSDETN